jgi:hypothetical protein
MGGGKRETEDERREMKDGRGKTRNREDGIVLLDIRLG